MAGMDCSGCHRANAAIGNISRRACFTCHEPCRNVDEGVDNELCLDCHVHDYNDEWIYRFHDEPLPQPPDGFDLLEPEHNGWVEHEWLILDWESARDPDRNDLITYRVEVSENEDFEEYQSFDAAENTEFVMFDIPDSSYFLWRVKALDLNTDGDDSTQCETAFEAYITPNPNESAPYNSPIPTEFYLSEAYPNPFNSTMHIRFALPVFSSVAFRIIAETGSEIYRMNRGYSAGSHRFSFNAEKMPTGIYFIQVDAGNYGKYFRKSLLIK